MVSFCATGRRNAAWTDYRAGKGFLFLALSGWPIAGISLAERKRRANCLSACSTCETTWDFFPRNTIHARNGSLEISRRHFRTSRSFVLGESSATKACCSVQKIKLAPRWKKRAAGSNPQREQFQPNSSSSPGLPAGQDE